ncbi:hypothetical protein M569_08034, partial [Genlisea aurea]
LSMALTTVLLLLLLLLLAVDGAHCVTHPRDVRVLKLLKGTIVSGGAALPPASCIASWDFAVDPCDAVFSDKFTCGIRCDAYAGNFSRVTEVALDSAAYSGDISAVDWNLPFLQNLDVSTNAFYGRMPASFSALIQLRRLSLSHNSLSGGLSDSVASLANLEELYLDNNFFTGGIPPNFGNLRTLKRLELQGNRLTGAFTDLGRLTGLNFLDASDNWLSGGLPASLPPSLVELVARNNGIEGEIGANLMPPSLQVLDLSHNKLSGSVPSDLFTHPGLEQLTLSFNELESVQIPDDYYMGLLSDRLVSADLSNNRIEGLLPGFMGLMPRLAALSLEENRFWGFIPPEYVMKIVINGPISGRTQFVRLLLGGNYLFGPIPGGFLELKPGSVDIRLGDNCLFRCPVRFFFCGGGPQKPSFQCRK